MTPQQFIAKWQKADLSERSAAQQHFLDLCELLEQPKPAEADPEGTHYTFERGAHKMDGGEGWADVWLRGHFGWEYKGKRKDLAAAYRQLLQYREALENPPLLVVCDLDRFEVHTNFTGTAKKVYAFSLADLGDPPNLDVLRRLFTDPESLKPGLTAERITRQAAERIGQVADSMRLRGIPAPRAAHLLMKLMFCMFAEDIGLLPANMFSRMLANCKTDPDRLTRQLAALFEAMAHGGDFGADPVLHFNGGLFADAEVEMLTVSEIQHLSDANIHNWADVEPSIFGTLFERLLDPAKRSQIGAHYTSRADIETIVKPVIMQPLRREWAEVQSRCDALWPRIQEESRRQAGKKIVLGRTTKASKPRAAFDKLISDFVQRLSHVRILDPACGSGNFLYVAINLLLDLEKEVIAYGAAHGLTQLPQVRPTQLAGIEINRYAQELAQVVIWIGYIQWMHHNGFNPPRNPVLDPIESVRCMDAILDLSDPEHPTEPEWPEADFIVGNPPFLGGNLLRQHLGERYVDALATVWGGRVPRGADLCCYWFAKGREAVARGCGSRVGLLATQGIRGGENRDVLKRICQTGAIFFAQSDRDWVLDGANVHVSMVGFDDGGEKSRELDGMRVAEIHANLTAHCDVTRAQKLPENMGVCLRPPEKGGKFELDEAIAAQMLQSPNPNGRPNSDVVFPWMNAAAFVGAREHFWIVDFHADFDEERASQYESPFEWVRTNVREFRQRNRYENLRRAWWVLRRPGAELRAAQLKQQRLLWTPMVSKHRIFAWAPAIIQPDKTIYAFASADDFFLGLVHGRPHECWARSQASQLRERESGLRYTPTTCFETFPFPEPSGGLRDAIAAAARELDELRNRWLNPPEWTREEILEFPGSAEGPWRRYVTNPDSRGIGTVRYPRVVPKDTECASHLAKRTLTKLYNERPTWLDLAHKKLDAAVFAAYGWPPDLSDEQILERLLALNLERAAGAAGAETQA